MKRVLLIVEIAAVVGLILSAGWLWQLRQQLQGELEVAEQIEAALSAGEQSPVAGQESGHALVSCQIVDDSRATEPQQPCRLEVPALGLDAVLLAGSAREALMSALSSELESPVFVISQETFARIIKMPEQLQGSIIRLGSGDRAVQVVIEKASLVRSEGQGQTAAAQYLSLKPVSSQNSSGEIERIIIISDHESD